MSAVVQLTQSPLSWITPRQAAVILEINYDRLLQARSRFGTDWPVEWKWRSESNCRAGLFLLREDVERLAAIRHRCNLSFEGALRVLGALQKAPL